MKRIIAVILSLCVVFAVVFACVSYIDYSNRPDALSEACGIELSDVVTNKNILNFHKDGFYIYAKLSVNDREIDKIIERLTAARYVLDDTKNERHSIYIRLRTLSWKSHGLGGQLLNHAHE